MTQTPIRRHTINRAEVDEAAVDYKETMQENRTLSVATADELQLLAQKASWYACCVSITDPSAGDPELLDALMLAAEAKTALFTIATAAPGSTIDITLDDHTIEVPAGLHWNRTRNDWHEAYNWATIIRRGDLGNELITIDDVTLTVPGITYASYARAWTDALRAVWYGDLETTGEHLGTALQLVTASDDDWAQHIATPAMVVLADILQNKPDGFNTHLASALEDHKTYWSTPEHQHNPTGFLSYELLALCALAYDYEMPIEVKSDYIPWHLITGDWITEA